MDDANPREAFVPAPEGGRSFHARAVDAARPHRERVAADLSKLAFARVFPELAAALAEQAPDAPLPEVRDAALIFLYRLLFLFYAEDRGLLPVRDPRYGAYALRDNVRRDVGRRMDEDGAFSERAARYRTMIDDLCRTIAAGDESIGLPRHDGRLFDRSGAPLLARVRLGDSVVARIVDALSFRSGPDGARRYIDYSELGVQQLGSIYERLLERELVRGDGGGVAVRLAPFARKDSGSYYTPDDDGAARRGLRPTCEDPAEFFALAYPTTNLRNLARDVTRRRPGEGGRIAGIRRALPPRVASLGGAGRGRRRRRATLESSSDRLAARQGLRPPLQPALRFDAPG